MASNSPSPPRLRRQDLDEDSFIESGSRDMTSDSSKYRPPSLTPPTTAQSWLSDRAVRGRGRPTVLEGDAPTVGLFHPYTDPTSLESLTELRDRANGAIAELERNRLTRPSTNKRDNPGLSSPGGSGTLHTRSNGSIARSDNPFPTGTNHPFHTGTRSGTSVMEDAQNRQKQSVPPWNKQ
jgi:hypothetical protein